MRRLAYAVGCLFFMSRMHGQTNKNVSQSIGVVGNEELVEVENR